MAGRVRHLIDSIITQRSRGSEAVAQSVRAKLALKGINPDSYSAGSADDPNILKKLELLAKELGVAV